MLKFSTLALVSVLALTACQKPGPQLGPDGQPTGTTPVEGL